MKKKWGAIGCVGLGIIFLVFSIFADIFKGERIDIGPSQKFLLIISLVIIGSSVAFLKFDINPIRALFRFLSICLSHIEKIINNARFPLEKLFVTKSSSSVQNLVFISILSCYSILYTLGRWNGTTPFIFLKSDASTIASFAAALDHPKEFSNDFMLFPLSNVQQYISVHIPIIRFLGKLLHGYGNAFIVILPVTIFLKLFGFYYLGKKVFKKPFYGFLLTFSTLPVIYTGVWDYWGLVGDALPRNFFEILFPWLILWTIQWNDKPKKWIIFGFVLGGLTYVHAISSPVIFLSIWTTLFISSEVTYSEKIRKFFITSLIYCTLIIPFMIGYFQPKIAGPQLEYEEGLSIMRMVYESHMDLAGITNNLIVQLLKSGLLIPFLFSSLILLIFWKNKSDNHGLVIGGWIVGILCFTIGLTFIETQIEEALHILPFQIFFIRGIRYLPPLLVIMIFLSFIQVVPISRKVPHPSIARLTLNIFFVFLTITIFSMSSSKNPQGDYISREIGCLQSGKIICHTSDEMDSIDIIRATRELSNEGEIVLALPPLNVSFERSIRYEALRPLGYNLPDVSRLNDPYRIKKVNEILEPWNLVEHAPFEEKLSSYLMLAEKMGVNWLIIQKKDFPNNQIENLNVSYSNSSYALVKVGN